MQQETKIICTLGPASTNRAILQRMAKSGMNVVRLNFSHGDHQSHAGLIDAVHGINKEFGYSLRILQDLEGPRIRIGHIDSEIVVEKGNVFRLSTKLQSVRENVLPFDYSGSIGEIPVNKVLYIDDGRLRFTIIDRDDISIAIKAKQGGIISSRKGVNIPDLQLTQSSLSKKDLRDLDFGIKNKVDFVAQSFVNTAKDIEMVCSRIQASHNSGCKVIAKIENRSGVSNIDAIIRACDGIMVARGDLGISIPIYKVPLVQKYIIKWCNRLKKETIVATQMLESMTAFPYPTRAEVSDIANAIFDGADYVMLSGETAAGKYPAQSVAMMKKIVSFTEKNTNLQPDI